MKTHDDFKEFYKTELLHEIELLQQYRKTTSRKSTMMVFAAVFFWTIIWLLLPQNWRQLPPTGGTIFTFFIVANAFLLTIFFLLRWTWRGFHDEFKSRIIQKILHFINPTLKYYPHEHIGEYAFDQSGVFLNTYSRFKGDDLIRGNIGQTTMHCSELYVVDSDGESSTTIFKGLFVVADFNKKFYGQTIVLPDKAEKSLGRLGKKLQAINPRRDQLIQLDNSEFEREFVVYGSDQIEARYILTPAFMQRILDLRKKQNTQIHLSFYKSKVYIAVSLERNLFETKNGNQVDYIAACEYFQDMQMILGIVEDLNLNTRIWSKE